VVKSEGKVADLCQIAKRMIHYMHG